MQSKIEERYLRRGSYVHQMFGLTYASWLILPRTFLMDMPIEWQNQFTKLLEQYNEIIGEKAPEYKFEMYVQFKQNRRFCQIPKLYYDYRNTNHNDLLDKSY